MVPAKKGLSAAASVTWPGALDQHVEGAPARRWARMRQRHLRHQRTRYRVVQVGLDRRLGSATDAVLPFAVPLARGAAFVDAT